jgi:hypothetical protein
MIMKFGRNSLSRDRLKKLAENIEGLARKDEERIREAGRIDERRRQAAVELYSICAEFVASVNEMLSHIRLQFAPSEFSAEAFQDPGTNVFLINATGRVLHIEFRATDTLTSTEKFRVPYILEGVIRCFNQDMLDRTVIPEVHVFHCLERDRGYWTVFDPRTHRTAPFDQEYLIAQMERLV